MDKLILPQAVFTLPLHKPFVDVLACVIESRYGAADPLSLARALVLLPSRRARGSLQAAFTRLHGGQPHLLPRMQPVADVDEDALSGEYWLAQGAPAKALELPPPMPRGLRHILLTTLVVENGTPDTGQAALLARELARLLDAMALAGVGFDRLGELVPAELATHWQKTVDFLQGVQNRWPALLAREGMMDPIARRNALLLSVAEAWKQSPPPYPVIAAGSVGSQSATAALLKTIAGLPSGMVVLPGLDRDMGDEEWAALDETHPQWGLKQLLKHLGMQRGEMQMLDDDRIPASSAPARAKLLTLAMQPAAFTSTWRQAKLDVPAALSGLERMECASLREEAQAIALRLRAALEVPQARAAVVTQDRDLARMIAAAMRRFAITVDDSAGLPVWRTPPGVFLLLLAGMALSGVAPVPLLSLLKHPLCLLGMEPSACRRAARALERVALRGVRARAGIGALRRAVTASKEKDKAEMFVLLDALQAMAGDFMQAVRQEKTPFARLLRLHMEAAERMAGPRLWAGEAGMALWEELQELLQHCERLGAVETRQYAGLLQTLLPLSVRPAYGTHPRLHILSPMEARLQHFDLVVLAGLNEGAWPAKAESSPWMSRPMQHAFGLPLPEEVIGKSAHDFCLLACAKEVVLSRAYKTGGVATQPSRWLARMDTLLSAMQGRRWEWDASPYAAWAAVPSAVTLPPLAAPAPKPPVADRPRALSVTEIETWQRDPYAIYARRVLKLEPLEALDQEPDMSDFGSIVHRALQRFTEAYPATLPENVEAELERCGAEALAQLADRPAVAAFWQPRFAAAIPWLAEQERKRRVDVSALKAECKTTLVVDGLTLTTRIDRLEQHPDGAFTIIDYKTGGVPKAKDVASGLCPQLPLEALMARDGELAAGRLRSLSYWKLAGGRNEEMEIASGDEAAALCETALTRLRELIEAFSQPDMPYLACPDAGLAPRYNDYEHLERREEWEWLEEAV